MASFLLPKKILNVPKPQIPKPATNCNAISPHPLSLQRCAGPVTGGAGATAGAAARSAYRLCSCQCWCYRLALRKGLGFIVTMSESVSESVSVCVSVCVCVCVLVSGCGAGRVFDKCQGALQRLVSRIAKATYASMALASSMGIWTLLFLRAPL